MTQGRVRAGGRCRAPGEHDGGGRATRAAAVLLAGVIAGALTVGCGGPDVLRQIGEDDGGSFGAAIPDVPSHTSWTFGGIVMCVTTDDLATITEVEPVNGQNLEVVGFATGARDGEMFGSGFVDVRGAGFDPTSRSVDEPCIGVGTELVLEFRRGEGGPGTAESFVVRYDSPLGSGETEVPFQLRLCPAETLDYGCAPA